MARRTIADLAEAAGVGVATVDRVLNGRAPVKAETARRVLEAAEAIGFHASGLLRKRLEEQAVPRVLGFLLQRRTEEFYRILGSELAAATRACPRIRGKAVVEYLDDLSPANVARRLEQMGQAVDALAFVAADHPKVSKAIEMLRQEGLPAFALLSDVSAAGRAGFIGIDHRKAGRSAAWTIARLARRPGDVAILVGSHRYLGHELSEISFRSYFRESAPDFRLLETVASLESAQFAHEAILDLLKRNPGLVGIYVAGGGMEGVIAGLRDHGAFHDIVVICNELIADTREALLDGVIDMVIATPVASLAQACVAAMAKALEGAAPEAQTLLPFDLYIPENI